MTSTEFFNLSISRSTVKKLRNPEVFYSNPCFYSEFIKCINSWLSTPKCCKNTSTKPSMTSIYKSLSDIKEMGYRKDLTMEFTN